ncbi:myeloid differentiation primary response protein MyD88 [Copidosoma floridanum]|uniref:myeloid differentiation primary response protein MyD88 n=1 Tax=Copidosoma floridanum TaxID=29053 RepID=UPI0006C9792C|nr:myeloid differentiation primary response protein MyD88 [Copidosoma floridanum]
MEDLSGAPLSALSCETKELISTLLNPKRFIPTQNGLSRDWKGLAHVCKIDQETMRNIYHDADPTGRVLSISQNKLKDFNLQHLKEALEKIERWDVIDDTKELMEKDAKSYLERLQKSQNTAELNDKDVDSKILTIDDLILMEQGQDTQHYDAFVLYAQEDTEFANEVVQNLENENNMKLCLKERDLIAGVSFEYEAILRLILERCNRLILILSPDFFKSPANEFFLNCAQAAGINKKPERKIIPCIYKTCELPPQLQYFSKIYYNKLSPHLFWERLLHSIKVVNGTTMKVKQNNRTESKLSETKRQGLNTFFKKSVEKQLKDMPKGSDSKKSHLEISPAYKEAEPQKTPVKESVSESTLELPSLDGLSTLPSHSSVEYKQKDRKKDKIGKSYIKKFQTLIEKF